MKKYELDNLIEQLQYIQSEMEERNIDEIDLSCSTYGIYDDFISFTGKGYLSINRTIEKIKGGEYDE